MEINNIIENPPFYVKNYFIDTFPLIDNDDENNSSLSNVFSSEPNLNIFQESWLIKVTDMLYIILT